MIAQINRLQNQLIDANIDCLALIPGPNLKYITSIDFHLMERPVIALFFPERRPLFTLPDFEANRLADFDIEIFTYSDGQQPPAFILEAALHSLLDKPQSLAIEFLNMRVFEYKLLMQNLPTVEIHNADIVMSKLRQVKISEEILSIQRAINISEAAFEDMLGQIAAGMTEREIALLLAAAMTRLGGETPPFDPIILSGERSALPHGEAGDYQIAEGDLLLFDFGTSKAGYISDITRVVYLGKAPNGKITEIHNIVQLANEAGRAAARPGVTCEAVDQAARRVIEEAGYGPYFIHRTGHGIGMQPHEEPYIVSGNEKLLEAGMTFTVEPGIYIPGIGGIRIEDDVLVTETSGLTLTSLDRAIRIIP